jgi:DegV family protein with EDD domain
MAKKVALVTDSTCDIPKAWIEQYGIIVVPLTIIFGDQQYLDGVDLQAEEFYNRLLVDPIHPSTSQPTPKAFLEAYQKAEALEAQEILVITISSAMSGTIESARQAAQGFRLPVTFIDSKSNSMGLGWQVIAAARRQEAGGGLQEMLDAAEQVHQSLAYYISLDTIEYLSRGGRFGEAVRFINSVIRVKPLIYVRHETGTVGAALPARSRQSAIEGMYSEFFHHINPKLPIHITVLHNNAIEEAKTLSARVIQEYSPKELFISIVSPVLGVHTGPKALALCGYAGD